MFLRRLLRCLTCCSICFWSPSRKPLSPWLDMVENGGYEEGDERWRKRKKGGSKGTLQKWLFYVLFSQHSDASAEHANNLTTCW